MNDIIKEYPLLKSGKVRDVYDLGEYLLFVASDRISAFDCVLPTLIPNKGMVLTELSIFWFEMFKDLVPNHFVTNKIFEMYPNLSKYSDELKNRSMIVKKANVLPVECIVRGYIAGFGWEEYKKFGTLSGEKLPDNLQKSQELPTPMFTPSTKAESGHDENITYAETIKIVGENTAKQLKELSLKLYTSAKNYAKSKGIIICDTKFEFGIYDGKIILIDEILTPDSSRFWAVENYKIGTSPTSYDKQYVRDYLNTLNWDKEPPAPELPEDIVLKTREKYLQALKQLTGRSY